ncbi:hypothetical protein ACFV9E_11970 [Streptomyces sp. NPDC059835]|uniref:hypothetical protein n=1 Tax=Streptomyces sp. NPDC059835 TaxID=3346967 RepID=UPI003648A4DF
MDTNALNPRIELCAISTHAQALALHPSTPDSQRTALLNVADEAGDTAQHCYPGGPWEPTNLRVRLILDEARAEAAKAGLPPLDATDTAAFLLDSAVTHLRNSAYCRTKEVTSVELTAAPFGRRVEWSPITNVITHYADGSSRDTISYPDFKFGLYLQDLAVLLPPNSGDRLTLHVAPGPSLLPPDWFEVDLFSLFDPESSQDPEQDVEQDAPVITAIPEPAPDPTPVAPKARWTFPAENDHTGWVWHHIDREYVKGTVTRLHFINNGGRSKLTVRILDGTHKGMAPTLNRAIHADLIEEAHLMFKARHGARRKWPVHTLLERPATDTAGTDS